MDSDPRSVTRQLLDQCAAEPIHLSEAIQPHGYLLVCSLPHWAIQRYSANCTELFAERAPESLMALTLDKLLGIETIRNFGELLAMAGGEGRPARQSSIDLFGDGRRFDISLRYEWRTAVVEIEPRLWPVVASDPGPALQAMIGRVMAATSVSEYCRRVAEEIHSLTFYDRVLIYRLLDDHSGEVVAEAGAIAESEKSWLGLRFPASDIPEQARRLYLENWIRIIPDAAYEPVPLLPVQAHDAALDLSHVQLRSVSPVHCQYLRNMNVASSMSISLICEGRLWGLIACHHTTPHLPPLETRMTAELFGLTASLQLELQLRREAAAEVQRTRSLHESIIQAVASGEDSYDALVSQLDVLHQLVPSAGVAVAWSNELSWVGDGFSAEVTRPLMAFLSELASESFVSRDLGTDAPQLVMQAPRIRGLLVIALRVTEPVYILWWRGEWRHEVQWAGEPVKLRTHERLSPRSSFKAWAQTVEGLSSQWTAFEKECAERLRGSLDLELARRGRHDVAQRLAVRKAAMDRHRDMVIRLEAQIDRMLALGGFHDAVAETANAGFPRFLRMTRQRIVDLAERSLMPWRHSDTPLSLQEVVGRAAGSLSGQGDRLSIDGPTAWIMPDAAEIVAAALCELVAHAIERGALQQDSASIRILWRGSQGKGWMLQWTESGFQVPSGEDFNQPFSRVFMLHSLPFELQGSSRVRLRPSGLQAEFTVPARFCTSQPDESHEEGAEPEKT